MSGKFVRASKFRHVFGQAAKKELCYENLKITKNAWDSNIIQSNGKYLSVTWDSSGGGAFAVIPIDEVGKAPDQVPLFRGHKGPVLDTAFDPFNSEHVASCSDDGKINIWKIPTEEGYSFHKFVNDNDEIKDIVEPIQVLSGHTRKVGKILYHPTAQNILVSSSLDYSVKVWNLETGKDVITLQHKDLVTSFSFNYDGSLLATTSRDKILRIWDIRSGKVISEGPGHTGAKPSRICWLGNTDRILTTGFSRLSDRQIGIWNVKDISAGPIDGFIVIDSSSGVLIPFYDESTSILYLAGKGDGNIRYYEYESETDELYEISQYSSVDPQRGFAASPKYAVNVKENEVLKCFKTLKDSCIEPISFTVPRRSELFQVDIYPDCPSYEPALSAEKWLSGSDCNGPKLMSMEELYEGNSPPVFKDSAPRAAAPKKEAETKTTESPKAASSAVESPKVTETREQAEELKPVDEVLKSSSSVNAMLEKANDVSENEDKDDGDDWEEVQPIEKEAPAIVTPKAATPEVETPKVETPKAATPKAATPKVETPKVETPKSEVSPSKPAVAEPAAPTPAATKTAGAPTLKNMVEKLHTLIEKLENQVTTLTEAGLEKDERLHRLEGKIEELLKK
ncbi:coronin-like protein [[Candida] railenensis]|uniref:Coronin n=1 Tax=[Candida] railenensis TaxID=45579 RepID=A0A9P0QUM2_9ASCO|nr:coronin-like protein [[Candida] railenensis]